MNKKDHVQFNYQELTESVQDLIFALSREGRFLYVNRQFSDFSGKSKDLLTNMNFLDLVYTQDHDLTEANLQQTLLGGATTFEVRLLQKNGEPVYFSTNITPIKERKQIVGVVGISRDINERMKLEQEITELKNFNESIIQSIQSGLITLDLEGAVTSYNLGAEEVLAYTAEEAIGRPIHEILGHEAANNLPMYLEGRSAPLNREMTAVTKSGSEVHIGFTVTPRLDDKGKRVGTIITFKDISQIQRMQAEVIRMDRLASLGVLASGIAHEIKNPLAGIKTMAQTLEEDFSDDDERRVYLARIVRQVNRLDELLKTFFDYARPRAPMKKLHRVQDIVHEVFTLIDKKLTDRNVEWRECFAPDTPAIFVDFHQIQQVLLNFIFNAIDAMEERGGTLKISAHPYSGTGDEYPRFRHIGDDSMKYVEIEVDDNGMGIDQKNLESIFDPFFTTKSQGTGLGLSIVYRIISAHGGEIVVETKVKEGTTFKLLLPTEESAA